MTKRVENIQFGPGTAVDPASPGFRAEARRIWAINKDEAILDTVREVVKETMAKDVEPLMCRRVRDGKHAGSKHRKKTGNLLYADFLHTTSRPVDGKADPHLHVHAYVMNYTHDDGVHYAAEMEEIFSQKASLQAKFQARLARRLQEAHGLELAKTRFLQSKQLKSGWEIKQLANRSLIEKFSRRTTQIEAFADKHGIADPAVKAKLGKRTRE